jgi:DNA-binding NtrC family response regulator
MAVLLLADGDRNFREALAIALRLDGIAVRSQGSADAALDELRRGGLDACLVDLRLPGADALLDAALAAGLATAVTGPHEDLVAHAARRHPHTRALPKPFGPAEVAELLAAPVPATP